LKDSSHRGCRRGFLSEIAGVGLNDASGMVTDPRGKPGGECRDVDMSGTDRSRAGLTRQPQPGRHHEFVKVTHRRTPSRSHRLHTSSVDT